nr:zincin-like metallopeptidase domain-containing protein [Thalassobacillus devorans]
MLCGVTGIENSTIDNSASYIQSWLRKLKEDKTLIVSASQQAQKASDYILGQY